jgi:hypothetical protein
MKLTKTFSQIAFRIRFLMMTANNDNLTRLLSTEGTAELRNELESLETAQNADHM